MSWDAANRAWKDSAVADGGRVLPIEGTALAKAEMEENKEMKRRVS